MFRSRRFAFASSSTRRLKHSLTHASWCGNTKYEEDNLYFPDGSGRERAVVGEQIAKSPPRGFPIWGDCETEKPVDTIQPLYRVYNHVVQERSRRSRPARHRARRVDRRGKVSIKSSHLNPVHEDEQITLFNSTSSSVRCRATRGPAKIAVRHGADLVAEFRVGNLLSDIVAPGSFHKSQ